MNAFNCHSYFASEWTVHFLKKTVFLGMQCYTILMMSKINKTNCTFILKFITMWLDEFWKVQNARQSREMMQTIHGQNLFTVQNVKLKSWWYGLVKWKRFCKCCMSHFYIQEDVTTNIVDIYPTTAPGEWRCSQHTVCPFAVPLNWSVTNG